MTYVKTPQILWGANMRTYMHGSQVERNFKDGSVRFYNRFGFRNGATSPSLPYKIIKKSDPARVFAFVEKRSDLPTRIFFIRRFHKTRFITKVSFWDRYDKEVKQIIEKSHSVTFLSTKEEAYYSIALLSAVEL